MKIQSTARIESLAIDGRSWDLTHNDTIELEFSAIDTGGGFKDPILDFSFSIPKSNAIDLEEKRHEISLELSDPDNEENKAQFLHMGMLKAKSNNLIAVNGRLKDDKMSRELIGFVLKLLR